ncbi:unnamed protein product [Victoria cruziana]
MIHCSKSIYHQILQVHRVLMNIVYASASATPGLGRYLPFKHEVVSIASAALDEFRNESKNMVVALVDMERAFVPPQHFICLVQRRSKFVASGSSYGHLKYNETRLHHSFPHLLSLVEWRRRKNIHRLQEYVKSEYDHSYLHSCRSRALYKGMKDSHPS